MTPYPDHRITCARAARGLLARRVGLTLAAAGVLAALAGCQRTRRTADDTLVVVIPAAIRDLDPRFAIGNYDTKLSRVIAPGLTSIDQPSLEPRPELAESVTPVDELTWDVVLRDGLRFSDGTALTARDVVYTFESVMDPATGSLFQRGFTERFRAIEALDERRVRLHLVEPLATLLSDLDFGIVSAEAAAAGGGRFRDSRVVGAGPYRVVSTGAERIVLERNPHYFRELPPSPRVVVRTVRDSNARTLMLVGGSADLTQNAIRVDLVDDVLARDRIQVMSGPSAILTYLMMNNDHPVLSDERVRRAIAHAVDRERIVRGKFNGRAVLATGLLPPSHWAYRADVPRFGYDPDEARRLLDEAGYPEGPGGGPRLRLTYKTSADQFRLAIVRIIAAQLAEVGIQVEVRAFEFGTFFADIKQGNYELASMQTADITEPDYYYAYFHSSRIPTPSDPDVHNRWRYRNERVDALTEEGRRVSDRGRRIELYGEVQEILARELPVIPLWHEDNIAVMNVDVRDYEVLPSARFSGLAKAWKAD
jgi:peptide/nickel transport system substrate-binding protein